MNAFLASGVLASSLVLAACGGGGGDDAIVSAEGIWGGTSSTDLVTALIVLENGETWGLYGGTGVAGILYGRTSLNSNQVSGQVKDMNLLASGTADATYTGTVLTRTSLDLRLGTAGTTLKASYDSSYDTPASLARSAGTYSGSLLTTGGGKDEAVKLQLDASGHVTGTTSTAGCTVSGTATPRAGGKNILNFNIAFAGSGCLVASGTTVQGVAQQDGKEITAIGILPAATGGMLFYGER